MVLSGTACHHHGGWAGGPPPILENPFQLPPGDPEFMWNQLVDAVDDYFIIERESRVRTTGGIPTEGVIETFPQTGATVLEPWRRDSQPGFERWQATYQSIRRQATIRVIPNAAGYLVDVQVEKQLEDLDRPEAATVAAPVLRHDGSLVRVQPTGQNTPITLGWISLGRDVELEQALLRQLHARLTSH